MEKIQGLSPSEFLRHLCMSGEIAGREAIENPEGWVKGSLEQFGKGETWQEQLTFGTWIEWNSTTIDGDIIVNTFKEISSERFAHIQLMDALNSTRDGFALWNQAGQLTFFNSVFSKIFSTSKNPLRLGSKKDDVYSIAVIADSFIEPQEAVQRLIPHVRSFSATTQHNILQHKDGRWFGVFDQRMTDGGNVSVFSDITEIKEKELELVLYGQKLSDMYSDLELSKNILEEHSSRLVEMAEELDATRIEAEHANRVKSEFLAHMSHELRTPLNTIIGFSEIITNEILGELGHIKYREYSHDINGSAQHLLDIINGILDLSKVEAGEMELEESAVDLGSAINNSLRMVELRGKSKGINLITDIASTIQGLWADEVLLCQILVNLLTNAIKFTPEGGTVTVKATVDDQKITMLSVEDTGIGIANNDIPRALEAFGQVRNSSHSSHEGTGLGLPFSMKLAELHGGQLTIESEEGIGTKVMVAFPLDRTIKNS